MTKMQETLIYLVIFSFWLIRLYYKLYDKKTRKLIDKIYTIIQNNMIKEDAYALCTKIQEELKK